MSRIPFPMPFLKERQISLTDLQDEMNGLFQRLWHTGLSTGPFDGQEWAPLIDVLERPDCFVIRAEVPGLDASGIEVSYSGGVLTLQGEKPTDHEEDVSVVQHERRFGRFARRVNLPTDVDPEQMCASCRHGVLEVTVKKTVEAQPKTIKVSVAE